MKVPRWMFPAVVFVWFGVQACEKEKQPAPSEPPARATAGSRPKKPIEGSPETTPEQAPAPTQPTGKNLVKVRRPATLKDLEKGDLVPASDSDSELEAAFSDEKLKVVLSDEELKSAVLGVAKDHTDPELKVSASGLMRNDAGDKGHVLKALVSNKSTDLSRNQISGIVKENLTKIQDCFKKALEIEPKLKGKVVMRWTISRSGSVKQLKVKKNTTRSKHLASCMAKEISTWKFPKLKDGEAVIDYPFHFNSM